MGHAEDLNKQKRAQAKLDAAAGGPRLVDRYGRPIFVGCQIEFHSPLPIAFEIVDAKPDLRPEAKPGTWVLQLVAQFPLLTANNIRMERITVVGYPEPSETATLEEAENAAADAAASDAEAAQPSSIVLTDMDAAARETLAEATAPAAAAPPPALRLVDTPADEVEG